MKILTLNNTLLVLLLLIPSVCFSLTDNQKFLLDISYNQGKMIGYPETIAAIAITETNLGLSGKYGDIDKPIGKKSYGICQIQLNTAKFVLEDILKINPFSYEEQIIVTLITNDTFNIHIATIYFEWLLKQFQGKQMWSRAVLAYNFGIGNVKKYGLRIDPNNYVDKVNNNIRNIVRPYNKIHHK